MIVCVCKGVSSRTILDEVRRGNASMQGIADSCQAGTGCGCCKQQIRQLVEVARTNRRGHDEVVRRMRSKG